MRDTDKARFAQIVNGLSAIKPGQKLTADGVEMFWRAMRTWEIDAFEAAAEQLARTSEFMPNPYHFEQLRKAGQTTPGEAFARALDVARDCSRHNAASSGDARIDAAARACGGYFAMGQYETEKLGFLERTFTEHFETISDAEDTREALPQIAGPSRARVSGPRALVEISDETYNGRQS